MFSPLAPGWPPRPLPGAEDLVARGAPAGPRHRRQAGGEQQHRGGPAAGEVVEPAQHQRAGGRQQVAHALGHPAEAGRGQRARAPQHDEGQCQGEAAALRQAEGGDPDRRALPGREQQAPQADDVGGEDGEHQRALAAHPPGLGRRQQRPHGSDDVAQPEQQPALGHRHPGVDQQRRQPGADRVELHALQAEEQRHLAGQRPAQQRPGPAVGHRVPSGPVRAAGAGDRQPQRQGGQCEGQPAGQPAAPPPAHGRGERDGGRRPDGSPDVERRGVRPHHQARPGRLALDVGGHEHVRDGDRRTRQQAAGVEHGHGREQPQCDARGQHQQRRRDGELEAHPPGGARRQRGEGAEAEHRQRGEQPGHHGGQAGVGPQVPQQRGHGDDGRSLVQRDGDDGGDEQQRGPAGARRPLVVHPGQLTTPGATGGPAPGARRRMGWRRRARSSIVSAITPPHGR